MRLASKFIIGFVLLAGTSWAQPQLSIVGYSSYTDSLNSSIFPHFIFYDLEVANLDSFATFNDSLFINLDVEDPPGTFTPAGIGNAGGGIQNIPPLSSIFFDTVIINIDTSLLKDGNNTVVIWPSHRPFNNYYTHDSLYLSFFLTLFEDLDDLIPVIIAPNPTSDVVYIGDPKNQLLGVKLMNTNGELISHYGLVNQISLMHLPNGIYLLELTTKKSVVRRKLVVQR